MKFFRKNKLACLVFVLLFFLPFCWHKGGEVDYGGDSTRLYFYDPLSWLKNISLYYVNSLMPLGEAMPNFSLIPFLLLLTFLKTILFNSAFLLNNFFNGFLLSGGFFSVYLIVKELLTVKVNKEEAKYLGPSIISGLFFVLSPLLIYQWERALYGFNQVLVYPLVFFLFLRYLNTGKFKFIIYMSLVCLVFSLNFSYPTVPWSFAYFPFAFIFLFLYSCLNSPKSRFIKGFIVFICLSLFLNSFDILPQIYSLINPSKQMASDRATMGNSGLSYFLSVQPYVRLSYNLTAQDQYVITSGYDHPLKPLIFNFGIKLLPIFFAYPLLLVLGLILKKNHLNEFQLKLFRIIFLLFLILLFFMSGGIISLGLEFFKILFSFSWFSMFRSFYSKFSMVYIFFYALLLGFSLFILMDVIKSKKIKNLAVIFLFLIILFNGWPLLSGKISNTILWRSSNVGISTEFDPKYQLFLDRLKSEKSTFKVLSLPLTSENYQVLSGKNKGVYFGPSTVGILAGKNSFNGITGFSVFWPSLKKIILKKNYQDLDKLLSLLNIGYIFHDSNNYVYDSFAVFPYYPYLDWLKDKFPSQDKIKEFVESLNYKKIFSLSSFNLYKKNNLLPRLYVPEKVVSTNSNLGILPDIIGDEEFDLRTAIYFSGTASGSYESDYFVQNSSAFFVKAESDDTDALETIKRISEKEVSYPFVQDRKMGLWKAFLLNERYKEWLSRTDNAGLIRQELYFANKRINEVVSFKKYENERLENYSGKINKVIFLLNKINDSNLQLELSSEIVNNLHDNLKRLKNADIKNYQKWEDVIDMSLGQTAKFIPQININERNYNFNIPNNGNYKVYLNGDSLENSFNLASQGFLLKIYDKRTGDIKQQSLTADSKGFINLNKGSYRAVAFVGKNPNLLLGRDWKEQKSTTQSKYLFKEINEFNSSSFYRVSGELKEEGEIKVILAEKTGDSSDGQRRLNDLPQYKIVREATLDQNSKRFDWIIDFSDSSDSVGLFVYNSKTGNLEKDKFVKTLESFEIINVFQPEIVLKSTNQIMPTRTIPRISILKENSTKYRIRVAKAQIPYVLILSDRFDSGWKLYHFKVQNYFSKSIATYFNDEIEEKEPLNTFIDGNTFETWGKRPIAEDKHFPINGYANAWLILPEDVNVNETYELIVEYVPQRLFYIGSAVSIISLFGSLIFLLKKGF